jgi:hypothetical protein
VAVLRENRVTSPLDVLTRQQRERITGPEFYQHLQKQLGDRFLRLLE